MADENFTGMLDNFQRELEKKTGVTGNPQFFPAWRCQILVFVPSIIPLQYECHNGDNDEDYHEPFCNFHSETGYPSHAQYKKNQGQYKENYRKID
jgi:hypothetical protein